MLISAAFSALMIAATIPRTILPRRSTDNRNGNRQYTEPHKLRRARKREGRSGALLVFEVQLGKFCHDSLARAGNDPGGKRSDNTFHIRPDMLGYQPVKRYSAKLYKLALRKAQRNNAGYTAAGSDHRKYKGYFAKYPPESGKAL